MPSRLGIVSAMSGKMKAVRRVLAYALDSRAHAIVAPDRLEECFALAAELLDVAARSGDRERLVAAHLVRTWQHVLGQTREAEDELAAASRIAEELRQPAQLWLVRASQAMLALAKGRLDEAEVLIPAAFALGERSQPDAAVPHYRIQRLTLFDFRGRLPEAQSEIASLAAEYPARPVFRCALAFLQARLGRRAEARSSLDDLARDGYAGLPFDQEWLFGTSLLAEVAALTEHAEAARPLYELLSPWAAYSAVDVGEGFRGSVARYLGLLAGTLGDSSAAAGHFEDALALNEKMDARPWLAHTQSDYAHLRLASANPGDHARAQELLDAALATYRELGMDGYAAKASGVAGETVAPPA